MTILSEIVANKKQEVAFKKKCIPKEALKQFPLYSRKTYSLVSSIKNKDFSIIAEYKRRSPSRSIIHQGHSIWEIARSYDLAEAAGISVLTDGKYFGGSLDDLVIARAATHTPLLRKEFIIDEYQLFEAKAYGADVVLLIASILSANDLVKLSEMAKEIDLEVLLEVHEKNELEKSLLPSVDLIGINNRNLKTFEVSLETSIHLAKQIPNSYLKVAESGLSDTKSIVQLKKKGFDAFLIGEYFMRQDNPGKTLKNLIFELTFNSDTP